MIVSLRFTLIAAPPLSTHFTGALTRARSARHDRSISPACASKQPSFNAVCVSAAASAERIYVDLKRTFDGAQPQLSAGLLDIGEQQLMRLVERAFEVAKSPVLRKLLKAHYPSLVVCREAMARLSSRKVA